MKSFLEYINEQTTDQTVVILKQFLSALENSRRIAQLAHWNVRGATFKELHELFGAIYHYLDEQIDAVAERILALNNDLLVQIEDTINPEPTADINQNIDALVTSCNLSVIKESMPLMDAVTANLVQEIILQLEKFKWMLNASKI